MRDWFAKWRLRVLLAVLVALLLWAWLNDYSGPAYPQGWFRALMLEVLLIVIVIGFPIGICREIRKHRD